MRALLLAVGIAVAAIVIASNTQDEGEVVTLITRNGSAADYDTQLWIVDWNGQLYLRAGSPRAHWLERLRANPLVTLKRQGETLAFTALPKDDPETRAAVNDHMAAKYGYADRLWGHLGDRRRSVPILLEPRPGP
jgi:hypothetical protein